MKEITLFTLITLSLFACKDKNENAHPKYHDIVLALEWSHPSALSTVNFYKDSVKIGTISAEESGTMVLIADPITEHPAEFQYTMEPIFIDANDDRDVYFSFTVEHDDRQYSSGQTGVLKPGEKMTINKAIE